MQINDSANDGSLAMAMPKRRHAIESKAGNSINEK
jgi:hypothetical protein